MSAGDFLDFTGGATVITDGPLIGNAGTALSVPSGDYLTTGDLAPADAGDASALVDFSVELWFRTASITTGFTQSLLSGPDIGGAARQWTLTFDSGNNFNFVVRNFSNTAQNVTSPANGIVAGAWYHVMATRGSNTLRIYVNGVEVNNAVCSESVRSGLTAGSADLRIGSASNTIAINVAEVAFYRAALGADRALSHYQAGRERGFPAQVTGTRIAAALDAVGSAARRRIDTGVRTITPRYMVGQSPLDAIREAVASEAIDANFFVAADGTLVFLDSDHRSSSPYNTSQATFGDAGGSELSYVAVTIDYSEAFLFNQWSVTREGSAEDPGATATVSDATSIARYRKRPQSLTGLPIVDDATSTTIATGMLAKYKNPMQRVTGLTLSTLDPDVAEVLFRRELGDKITVKRTPPGGGARISQVLWIQKIEISGANDGAPWQVRWAVSPV